MFFTPSVMKNNGMEVSIQSHLNYQVRPVQNEGNWHLEPVTPELLTCTKWCMEYPPNIAKEACCLTAVCKYGRISR